MYSDDKYKYLQPVINYCCRWDELVINLSVLIIAPIIFIAC